MRSPHTIAVDCTLLFETHNARQWLQEESEVDLESEYNSSTTSVNSNEITYNRKWSQSSYHNAKEK